VTEHAPILDVVVAIAQEAGRVILPYYEARVAALTKADGTPVTAADTAAESVILAALAQLTPGIPVVAEEMMASGATPRVGRRFWLVDPIDGTKEFIARTGEFTVNIGLIEDGVPILGVIHVPVTGDTYFGSGGAGGRAFRSRPGETPHPIRARPVPAGNRVALASRHSGIGERYERVLAELRAIERRVVGSSLKFCLLASGEADVYPRPGETNEWDTAAGHAIVLAAGGRVDGLDGHPLTYGKPGFLNKGFIAWGAAGPTP